MKQLIIPFTLLSACLITACGRSTQDTTATTIDTTMKKSDTTIYANKDAQKLDTSDVSFFQSAAYGGMIEVEISKKILEATKDSKIIDFANMMVKDHGDANKKLAALANQKGYMLPHSLPPSKIAEINKMTTLKLEAQNEYYAKLMIKEHDKAIAIFSMASRSLDSNIASFAKQTLPTLNHHYQTIQKLDSALALPKVNQGDDPLKLSNRKH